LRATKSWLAAAHFMKTTTTPNAALEQLQAELSPYMTMLAGAAETIVDEGVSKYPIFVLSRKELAIGIPIIDGTKTPSNLWVNASTLEEFATKNLVGNEHLQDFLKIYKRHNRDICLFVSEGNSANFVFLPYKQTR
jgi:hypothetical protein